MNKIFVAYNKKLTEARAKQISTLNWKEIQKTLQNIARVDKTFTKKVKQGISDSTIDYVDVEFDEFVYTNQGIAFECDIRYDVDEDADPSDNCYIVFSKNSTDYNVYPVSLF